MLLHECMLHARTFKPQVWRELHELSSHFEAMSLLEAGPVVFGAMIESYGTYDLSTYLQDLRTAIGKNNIMSRIE